MRASQSPRKSRSVVSDAKEIHISGAEGIYSATEMSRVLKEYTDRALDHPRGRADRIVLTVEEMTGRIVETPCLPISRIKCASPVEAKTILSEKLAMLGVSSRAVNTAFRVLESCKTMRGAALVLCMSGKRAEPDKQRGVRVSRLGIKGPDEKMIMKMLSKNKADTETVREALVLASKVASCPGVMAEVCISDDPDYTTGYVASRKTGYLRIPNIKKHGHLNGGRVFFIKEDADTGRIIDYLEKKPVLIVVKS